MADAYWIYDFLGKKVFALNRNESYEEILEADGFAWFVVLPKKKTGSCLGLLNKYAGFMAVESMQENDETLIAVVTESGSLGWISEREPRKVSVGTADVTVKVLRDGNLYSVPLPETSSKTVLSIVW